MRNWTQHTVRIATAAGLLLSSVALSAAPVANKPAVKPIAVAKPAAAAATAHHVVVNSHLHLKPAAAAPAATAAKPGKAAKPTSIVSRHYGTSHYHYAEWAKLHRGTATIVGQVLGKTGSPVAGARVVLRGPKGHPLKSVAARHITTSSLNGQFVMRNVRLGSYRVRASKGKPNGHVNVVLHGGQTSSVQVKM